MYRSVHVPTGSSDENEFDPLVIKTEENLFGTRWNLTVAKAAVKRWNIEAKGSWQYELLLGHI